jgi:hypothetical protein
MLLTHVDLLEKILRCGLYDPKSMEAAGKAWWRKEDEQKETEENFKWLVTQKKQRGSLAEDWEFGQGRTEEEQSGNTTASFDGY